MIKLLVIDYFELDYCFIFDVMSMKLFLDFGVLKSLILICDIILVEFSCVKSKGLFFYLMIFVIGGFVVCEFLEGLGDFLILFVKLENLIIVGCLFCFIFLINF